MRPVRAIDLLRQLVGVGGLQFRERAVVEHDARQRIGRCQLLQHVLRGRGLPGRRLAHDRQLQLLEQDLLQLLAATRC